MDRMNAFCPVGCVCLRMRPAGFDELWASTASKECRHQKRKCGAKAGCLRSKKEEEKRDDLAAGQDQCSSICCLFINRDLLIGLWLARVQLSVSNRRVAGIWIV